MFKYCAAVMLAVGFSVLPAQGSVDFNTTTPILTVVQDASNLRLSTTDYQIYITPDSDVYLNSFTVIPGAGFDNNINLLVPPTFNYNGNSSSGVYTPGNLLAGGDTYQFWDAVQADGPQAAATGIYNFTLEIAGGDTPQSNDVLGDVPLQVEVINKLDVSATSQANPSTISPGQTTTVSATVTNHMTDRDFLIGTYGFINKGMTDSEGDALPHPQFVGNWSGTSIAPGDSVTGDHTTWTADSATPDGVYTGDLFIEGGLYYGDTLDVGLSPTVTVVPEPGATMLIALILPLAGLRRRRSDR